MEKLRFCLNDNSGFLKYINIAFHLSQLSPDFDFIAMFPAS